MGNVGKYTVHGACGICCFVRIHHVKDEALISIMKNAMWNQRDHLDVDSCFALGCGVPSAKSYWEQGVIDVRNVFLFEKTLIIS